MSTVKKFLAAAAVSATIAGTAVFGATPANAASCSFSEGRWHTATTYCPSGARHYIATRAWWQVYNTYYYGNFVRSYGTSWTNCYANERFWGTLVY